MSHEIYWVYTGSSTLYAQVRQGKQANQIWNTSGTPAFETYATANIADYDIALTEQGTGSNFYSGNFPTGITTPGLYLITIHEQAGGGPAESDTILSLGELHWNGSEARPVADTMWMNTGALDTPEAEISLKSLVVYNDAGTAVSFTSTAASPGLSISGNGGAVSLTSDTTEPTLLVQNYTGPAVLLESDFANAVNVVGHTDGISITGEGGPGLSVTSSHTSGYAVTISSSTCGGLSIVTSDTADSAVVIQNNSTSPTLFIENNNGVALTIDSASDSAVELIASTYAIETADTIKCGALTVSGATTLSGGMAISSGMSVAGGFALTGGLSSTGDWDIYSTITLYGYVESYSYVTIYGALTVTGQVSLNDGLYISNTNGPGLSVTSTHTSGYAAEFTSTSCGGLLITGGDDEPCVKIEHESPSSLLPGAIDVVGEVFFRSEPYGYVEASPSPADDAFDGYNGNLSSTDDFYNGMFLVFQSGTLSGQARQISDYVGATQSFAFNGSGTDLDRPFTTAPSTDNRFIILGLAKG